MHASSVLVLLVGLAGVSFGQQAQSFAVASVKLSPTSVGPDYGNRVAVGPARISASNATLKRLISEAYGVQPFQISGGPNWLASAEYELDARTEGAASADELRQKLRTLLVDRFGLAVHRESKELRVFHLVVDKGGPKIKPAKDGDASGDFHGDLQRFADLLSVQLSIPQATDPAKPAIASGAPVPVVNKTGLAGIYDIKLDIRPELGTDLFVLWQRALQERLGLRLENRKSSVELLVVDRADKVPAAN